KSEIGIGMRQGTGGRGSNFGQGVGGQHQKFVAQVLCSQLAQHTGEQFAGGSGRRLQVFDQKLSAGAATIGQSVLDGKIGKATEFAGEQAFDDGNGGLG